MRRAEGLPIIVRLRSRYGRRRWGLVLSSLVAALALWPAQTQAAGPPSTVPPCQTEAPASAVTPQAQSAVAELRGLIESVPCADSERMSYGTTDDVGGSMDVLDPITDPTGGYIGVYHTEFGPRPATDLLRVQQRDAHDPLGHLAPPSLALGNPYRLSLRDRSERAARPGPRGDRHAGRFQTLDGTGSETGGRGARSCRSARKSRRLAPVQLRRSSLANLRGTGHLG